MTIRFTQDIKTQQTVYAIVNSQGQAKYLTTSITEAIKLAQSK